MRATTAAAVLALTAASATAQSVGSPLDIARNLLNLLSPECRAVVSNLTQSSSPVYQCLQVDSLLPALLTNGSVIPPVDDYLSAVCYNDPCSQSLMNSTAQTIIEGCSADLDTFNVPNSTVYEVVGAYPLAREIACLKTTEPESFDNATIPISSTSYNSTNGTFCVTDLATDLSAYLGVNLTNNYIDSLALGANVTALQAVTAIPPTALCSDCVYAALDLIYTEYPQFGNITVDRRNNVTINSFLNQTCSATEDGFDVSNNGTLPDTIIPSADNSTFSATIVAGNVTHTPETATASVSTATASVSGTATIQTTTPASPVASVSAALTSAVAGAPSAISSAAAGITARGQMAEKRRWFGA